jgi:hypothetical protein
MKRMSQQLATPVAIFAYNRPAHVARSFKRIAQARPRQLFVILDGPNPGQPGDDALCREVRSIVGRIDWDCTVFRNEAPRNMGLRARVQSGLDWVFNHVDRAIIIEDDCLVDPTFFRFAEELLAFYERDDRIGLICAQGDELPPGNASYHASRYPLIWGWATWRRTWRLYEPDLITWPEVRDTSLLLDQLGDHLAAAYWRGQLNRAHGGLDTWDYMVNYLCWRHSLLCLHPAVNMIENIGFDLSASNTLYRHTPFAAHARAMTFPLIHPASLEVDHGREMRLLDMHFGVSSREALDRVRSRIAADAETHAG